MKYTVSILLLCTLFLVNSVYSLQGGVAVTVGAHPSHALVLVNNLPRGGVIVNVNHVVTSCRNVLNNENHLLPLTAFAIRAGSIAFPDGFTTQVNAVFPHPEFNPWTFKNDVAVLRTVTNFPFGDANEPTPNIAPAVFNERVIADGTNCMVVGFNNPVGGVAPLLQLVQPILNRDTGCNTEVIHNGGVLESMFCAGTVAANSGICETTIGGGIYCNRIFTGIASAGALCGAANSPGIYTQVRHHIPWITAQYTRAQIPQPGATPPPGVSAGIFSAVASSLLISLAFLLTKF